MTPERNIDLQATERSFLFAFVALRLFLFARYFGMFLGYDVRGHLDAVSLISWASPFLSLHHSYYSWHPPFGFLLTHTVTLFGISPLLSAQILSFAASLIAFFFMRLTLKSLGLLSELSGILFLYIGASIPMQVYLSVIVSLDVYVFCFMSIALYLSIRLLWGRQIVLMSLLSGFALVFILNLAILSKQSGFLLLPLPFLVFFFSKDFRTTKNFCVTVLVTATPFFFGMFYLYVRYYLPEHTFFFNSAGTFIWMQEVAEGVLWRDSHRMRFLLSYVLPLDGGPKLIPTWASFWYMFDARSIALATESLGLLYYCLAYIPCVIGIRAMAQQKRDSVWHRFGSIILVFSLFQLLGLFWYIYSLPLDGYIANKGIYIASVSWVIAMLFASGILSFLSHKFRLQKVPLTRHEIETYALGFTAFFMILNHLVPEIGGASLLF